MSKRLESIDSFFKSYMKEKYVKSLGDDHDDLERSLVWTLAMTNEQVLLVDVNDAKVLIQIACKFGDSLLSQVILPLAREFLSDVAFVVKLIKEMSKAVKEGRMVTRTTQSISNEILDDLIGNMRRYEYMKDKSGALFTQRAYKRPRNEVRTEHRRPVLANLGSNVITLFSMSKKLSLSARLEDLAQFLVDIAHQPSNQPFIELLFPVLKCLPPKNASIDLLRYQHLFQNVMKCYIEQCNRKMP